MKQVLAVLLLLVVLSTVLCSSCHSSKRTIADATIAEIERFRNQNGRLPNSLGEIGRTETEEGPVYYEKRTDTRYVVWYGTTLGESMTYDSVVGHWEEHN